MSKARPGLMTATGAPVADVRMRKRVQTREVRLEALNKAYSNDPVFSHLRYRTPMIAGHGSVHPRVVFIEESPQPDVTSATSTQGRYLNGPERVVVRDLLKSIDLPEDHAYLTGLIKYQMPKGRGPRQEEWTPALDYLRRELEILQARTVVVFGRRLAELLLPGVDIVHEHGHVVEGINRRYVPMFHPIASLYNADIRRATFRDMARLNTII